MGTSPEEHDVKLTTARPHFKANKPKEVERNMRKWLYSNEAQLQYKRNLTFQDTVEIICHQDNRRSLLGDLRAGDSHAEPNVGKLQRRAIVCTIAGHCDDLSEFTEARNDNRLVSR